jgi:hypothetical protein
MVSGVELCATRRCRHSIDKYAFAQNALLSGWAVETRVPPHALNCFQVQLAQRGVLQVVVCKCPDELCDRCLFVNLQVIMLVVRASGPC